MRVCVTVCRTGHPWGQRGVPNKLLQRTARCDAGARTIRSSEVPASIYS